MKPEILFIILGVVIIATLIYYNRNVEGFAATVQQGAGTISQGPLPKPAQTSAVPSDMPNATTTDSSTAKAQPKDIEATLTDFQNFITLATQKDPNSTNLAEPMKRVMMDLVNNAPAIQNELQAALASSDASPVTLKEISDFRQAIKQVTNSLRDAIITNPSAGTQVQQTIATPSASKDAMYANLVANEPQPTVAAGPTNLITVQQLKDLHSRMIKEFNRLGALGSSAASVRSRMQQLEKLIADLFEMIQRVERGQMKIEDVPITPDSATKFLSELEGNTSPVPPLMVPAASLPSMVKTNPYAAQFDGVSHGQKGVEKLLKAARDLRWTVDIRLEYDPLLRTKERMLRRLETITRNLQTLTVSHTDMPPHIYDQYMKELGGIEHSLAKQRPAPPAGDVGPMSRLGTAYGRDTPRSSEAPAPSAEALQVAQGKGFGTTVSTFPHGESSPDIQIRPGFEMNDEQIARRASAASFIPAAGGADYKKRSLELCRQIKSAQLGDTKSFGCIENPDTVGPEYSWQGNFKMVCNRLGDSWGRAYPEQFGCPPYDPTAKFSSNF